MRLFILTFFFFTTTSAIAQEQKAREILNYSVQFSGTKAEGSFSGLEGKIVFDKEHPLKASFDIELDPASISTGNDTKDKHARSDNWLDVDTFPKIFFKSTSVREENGAYVCDGLLRFHGIERQESIFFSWQQEDKGVKLRGQMSIDRDEYDISGSLFGFVVGDDFSVDIEVLLY